MSAAARRANAFSGSSSGPASIAARAERIRRSAHRSATTSSFTGFPASKSSPEVSTLKRTSQVPTSSRRDRCSMAQKGGVVSRWLLSCPTIAANVSARMESNFPPTPVLVTLGAASSLSLRSDEGLRHRARFHLSIPKIGTPSDRGGSDDAGGRPRSLHRVLRRARARTRRPPRSVATECRRT